MSRDRMLHGPLTPGVKPEMQRLFALARLGNGAEVLVESTPAEREALSRRMGLPVLDLTCRFDLRPAEAEVVMAQCALRARVRQVCVVSLDAFDAEIVQDFGLRFVPPGGETEALDPEADDEVVYEGGVLDLGEAASEQLALALDPFPRKPGAVFEAAEAEAEPDDFGKLAKIFPPRHDA